MADLKHVYIEQAGTENVSKELLDTIADLADQDLDESSDLIGKVHAPLAGIGIVDKIQDRFPNLEVITDDEVIIDANRIDSEEMAANDRALMDVIYAKGWSASADYMTKKEAGKVSSIPNNLFLNNSNIINAEALQYFGTTALYTIL